MRWIIAIFIVLDVVYQLFAITTNVAWWVYYDVIHYGTLFSVALFYALKKGDSFILFLSLYLGYCFGNILFHIGLSKKEYLENIQLDYTSFGILAIIILLTFTAYKRWVK